jgi:shikimate kinase
MARKSNQVPRRAIVLVGQMGAGKSSVGRRLAVRLGLKFIDADNEIEAAAGCSIDDIFELHGEEAFREGERLVIARLLEESAHVLATGGGAFMDPSTQALIREKGISIWLRADLDILVRRIGRRGNRPLLKDRDKREVLKELMAERDPVYATADITVDTIDAPHETVVIEIMRRLVECPESGVRATKAPGAAEPGPQQATDPTP